MTLGSQAVDPHLHHVARLEIARRLGAMADSGRSAGGDEIARPERHEAADIGDELADREDHVLGVTALTALAVDRRPEREPCGSATSSAVTSQGPMGAKVSALLPLVVPPPCSIWKARSETSFMRRSGEATGEG